MTTTDFPEMIPSERYICRSVRYEEFSKGFLFLALQSGHYWLCCTSSMCGQNNQKRLIDNLMNSRILRFVLARNPFCATVALGCFCYCSLSRLSCCFLLFGEEQLNSMVLWLSTTFYATLFWVLLPASCWGCLQLQNVGNFKASPEDRNFTKEKEIVAKFKL